MYTLIVGLVKGCLLFIKAVKRVLRPVNVLAHDMGIDFRSFYIGVPEKLLQDADVHTMLKHMSGKRVAQGMNCGSFNNTGFYNRRFYRFLQS